MFGNVTTQIDQNLMVMQIIEEVSVKYGLAALLQEKPFQVGSTNPTLLLRSADLLLLRTAGRERVREAQ